jgi:hypothetical protein
MTDPDRILVVPPQIRKFAVAAEHRAFVLKE